MWIVLLAVGVTLTLLIPISISKGRKSKTWPTTRATVVSADVEEKHEYDEDGDKHVYYYPRIHYDYQVDGQFYNGFRYKLLEVSMSRRKAHEFISNFLTGDILTVYYDPEKPIESVLQPGEQKYLYVFFVIGIGLTIFSLVKLFL